MSAKSRFTDEEQKSLLNAIEQERKTASLQRVCETHQITPAMYYFWKGKFRNPVTHAEKLVECKTNSERLKLLIADLMLENQYLKQCVS